MADNGERFDLPEFTRSLRGFASVEAVGRASHETVFGPLLAARRSAARVEAPEARAAAFDADRLRRGLLDAIATIAADRSGSDAATRRALEARLEESAGLALRALDVIGQRAEVLRGASAADRQSAWAEWCDAVQGLFDQVDGFWLSVDLVAPPPRRGSGSRRLGAVLIATLVLHGGALGAQRVTVRIEARPDSLIAAGFDVVGSEPGGTLVVASPDERARLDALGFRTNAVIIPRAAGRADAQAMPTIYRSFDDPIRGIRSWVDSIAAANPRVTVDTIGLSFEGRPLLAIKIGPAGDIPTRPNALFVATYHAREWAATETALRLVKWLAAPPGGDARRDSLVQGRDIWVIPVANPDGYQYTFDVDRLWRKTRSPQGVSGTGVDMNRNHSVHWAFDNQGSSSFPGSDIFRGPAPASESETSSIEAFHAAHPPVVAMSYHTFSGLLLYPPGHRYGELPADLPVYQVLGGSNQRSAVTDRLPGSIRSAYAPGPGWQLYTTNGDYTDFAATRHGAIAFTTELTSGYGPAGYYGFEFPDDDVLLEQLFQDNLPFALDLLDAAADPTNFVSANTGGRAEMVRLESISPDIRATVPAPSAATATVSLSASLTFRVDSGAGGRYFRRIVASETGRPAAFSLTVNGVKSSYRVLAVSGAETADAPWTAEGFARDTIFARAGTGSWLGTRGTLTSPAVVVPADADTVSLVYWTAHVASGFSPNPSGSVYLSTDGGQSWSAVHVVRGSAPVFYTDGVMINGVKGKTIAVRFTSDGMPWRLDEIALVAHSPVTATQIAGGPQLRPSENPVRSGSVRFAWPFGTEAGELIAYDISGREVWRRHVDSGASQTWEVASLGVGNGVYIIVARASGGVAQLKLFVARRAP
ncbi:MAG: M14 family metallopeptidase [Gemmatimonadetes bacterium]|nr:M14 family metallopeptidase [Gemmatimonadota bacterium]